MFFFQKSMIFLEKVSFFPIISPMLDAREPREPLTNVYKMTPSDQTSTSGPSYFFPINNNNNKKSITQSNVNKWGKGKERNKEIKYDVTVIYPGKVREPHTVGYRKTYPACFLAWIRYWIQSRQFWYSFHYPITSFPPVHMNGRKQKKTNLTKKT